MINNLTKKDCETFKKAGVLTQPFLNDKIIEEKVLFDYNQKIKNNPKYTKLESLFYWINHKVKYSEDKEFRSANKFQRTAKEIWESGYATGCTDYAILFCTFARQLNIPTTFLQTAEYNWLNKLKSGESLNVNYGHAFCECFYNDEWILVDPTSRKIQFNYSCKKIELNYNVGGNNIFIPYYRGLDFGKIQSIKEHNDNMNNVCSSLNFYKN